MYKANPATARTANAAKKAAAIRRAEQGLFLGCPGLDKAVKAPNDGLHSPLLLDPPPPPALLYPLRYPGYPPMPENPYSL
jgi:hypothetical protein